jgi:hypothetical protein
MTENAVCEENCIQTAFYYMHLILIAVYQLHSLKLYPLYTHQTLLPHHIPYYLARPH